MELGAEHAMVWTRTALATARALAGQVQRVQLGGGESARSIGIALPLSSLVVSWAIVKLGMWWLRAGRFYVPGMPLRSFWELLKNMAKGERHATEAFCHSRRVHGPLYQGRFFGVWFVYCADPEGIRHILMNPDLYEKASPPPPSDNLCKPHTALG
eukprot:tig00000241_g20922.t1